MSDEPARVVVQITEEYLETFGDSSLIGTLFKETGHGFPPEVTISFPETSLQYKKANGGPHQFIVNEHTIRCLVNDILRLCERGVKVATETYIANPK